MGLHHAAITVKNIERSLAFYRDLLGPKVMIDTVVYTLGYGNLTRQKYGG